MKRALETFAAIAVIAFASAAHADVLFEGTGLWSPAVEASPWTAPNEPFQFSFVLKTINDEAPPPNTHNDVYDAVYSLNGAIIPNSISYVNLFSGPLNIIFTNLDDVVEGGNFITGGHVTYPGYSNAGSLFFGSGSTSSFSQSSIAWSVFASGAPEPGSWATLTLGVGIAGTFLRRRRSESQGKLLLV